MSLFNYFIPGSQNVIGYDNNSSYVEDINKLIVQMETMIEGQSPNAKPEPIYVNAKGGVRVISVNDNKFSIQLNNSGIADYGGLPYASVSNTDDVYTFTLNSFNDGDNYVITMKDKTEYKVYLYGTKISEIIPTFDVGQGYKVQSEPIYNFNDIEFQFYMPNQFTIVSATAQSTDANYYYPLNAEVVNTEDVNNETKVTAKIALTAGQLQALRVPITAKFTIQINGVQQDKTLDITVIPTYVTNVITGGDWTTVGIEKYAPYGVGVIMGTNQLSTPKITLDPKVDTSLITMNDENGDPVGTVKVDSDAHNKFTVSGLQSNHLYTVLLPNGQRFMIGEG